MASPRRLRADQVGVKVGWSVTIAAIMGLIGLATGPGYILIGIIYGGIWLSVLISRGVAREEAQLARAHECQNDYRRAMDTDGW